jgi:hypothetical protein
MRVGKTARIVLGFALLGGSASALADVPAVSVTETVVVVGTAEGTQKCADATPISARSLADKASQEGAYQRAGECYLVAGERSLADQAFVKAAAQASPDTSRRLAANLDEVKAQARQVKAAFRHR